MAQFDVVRLADGDLAVDCQADCLSDISTRFVVPLRTVDDAPPLRPGLNPLFAINGEQHAMVTQFAATVPTSELRETVGSLRLDYLVVTGALDMLISGY